VEDGLMRVGLIADTHDRIPAVAELLKLMLAGGVEIVLHAGDFCSPFSLDPFHHAQLPAAGVFGRNDGDQEGLIAAAGRGAVGVELYQSPHSLEIDGRRVLLVHDLSEVARRSVEGHEVVVHGCSHREEMRTRGETMLINPGEACGWINGSPSAAILDLETKRVEILKLTGPEWRF
jgi:putative phosphoesterase